jgi:Na+/melibiose symporter-like transporter
VGYSVNSETGNYVGDIAKLPGMVLGFGVFLTVVPAAVMLIGFILYKFLYPITPEFQQKMVETLAEQRDGEYERRADAIAAK